MRFPTALLLLGLAACDPKPTPPVLIPTSPAAVVQTSPERAVEESPAELTQRTRFEGRTVFTIKCDPTWHASRDCHDMDIFRSSFPVTVLTLKRGVLMEGDQPFRHRFACPKCVAN
jgi:hypothetical protein